MKMAFVYVPDDGVYPDDVLARYQNTRISQASNVVMFTPESVDGATTADNVREFRKEVAAYTNATDDPVLVAVDTADLSLLRNVVFEIIEHRLPVVFELDDDQRRIVRFEK